MKRTITTLLAGVLTVGLAGCASHRMATRQPQRVAHAAKVDKGAAARANVELALAFLNKGNADKAKEKLLRASKEAPKEPAVWYGLGYFHERTGTPELAESLYKKAIHYSGHKAGSAHNNYGTFLCRQKRYDEALHEFTKAATDEEYLDVAGAYENAGICSYGIPNYKLATQYFKKALNYDPNADIALYYLAKIAMQKQQFQAAEKYLSHLVEMEPDIPATIKMYAEVAQHLGKTDKYQRLMKQLANMGNGTPSTDLVG